MRPHLKWAVVLRAVVFSWVTEKAFNYYQLTTAAKRLVAVVSTWTDENEDGNNYVIMTGEDTDVGNGGLWSLVLIVLKKLKHSNGTEKHASSVTVCLGRNIKVTDFDCSAHWLEIRGDIQYEMTEKDSNAKWRGHNKEQLKKEMRKSSEGVFVFDFRPFGWTQESQALQREE